MNLAVNIKEEREREGVKETGGLQNFLIIPLKWGELILGEGGLIKREVTRRFTVNRTG